MGRLIEHNDSRDPQIWGPLHSHHP